MDTSTSLKRTPLFDNHRASRGRMVDFGGWEMPVQYSGLVDEHKTVRSAVGLFDVSHMGEILVDGPGAPAFLQGITTNDVTKLDVGQAQYSAMLYETGTVVDDILVYRRGTDSFLLCVNASNATKDFSWLRDHCPRSGVALTDASNDYAQIAVQGPRARELVSRIVDIRIEDMRYYHFAEGKVCGTPSIIARTGYTGELGYELYVPAATGAKIWDNLLEEGQNLGVKPCGLGARDTLRLEVAFMLYGNDMDDTTTVLEAGLGWITKISKGDFIGRDRLIAQKEAGLPRRIVGLEMVDKAVARHGYAVFASAEEVNPVGVVTSGTAGPSVGKNIAMAYVPNALSKEGTQIWVEVRGVRKLAQVVRRPFYTQGTAQN